MASVAANPDAAAAVATARSVAADRLRRSEAPRRPARAGRGSSTTRRSGPRGAADAARLGAQIETPDQVGRAVSDAIEQTRREIVNLRRLIMAAPAALDEDRARRRHRDPGGAQRPRLRRSGGGDAGENLGNGAAPRLARETETTVYRLVQGGAHQRRAALEASRVSVWVSGDRDTIDVSVSDDGHGFDTRASVGFGLRGMRGGGTARGRESWRSAPRRTALQ